MVNLNEQRLLNSYFSMNDISMFIHGLRSCFHVLVLATGLVYGFAQPLFLNFEVWSYVYLISAVVLTLDAYVFIFSKYFKYWRLLYFIDALFITCILYKTGSVFFPFLYSMWLVSIFLTGFQYKFKGAFIQFLWVSSLWTWLNLLSPYFEKVEMVSFITNIGILFVMSIISGFVGYRYQFFQHVFQWFRLGAHELVAEWRRLYGYDRSEEDSKDTSQLINSSALNKFLKNKLYPLIQDSDAKFNVLDINHLVRDITNELCETINMSSNYFQLSLKSSHKILGQRENLKIALLSVIRLFTVSGYNADKLLLSTYDQDGWIIVQIKSKSMDIKNPLWLFNSFSNLFFIHKILNDHKGKIYADKKDCSVTIQFPLNKKQKSFNQDIQSVS